MRKKHIPAALLYAAFVSFASCDGNEVEPRIWESSFFETDYEYQGISVLESDMVFVYGHKMNEFNDGLTYNLIRSDNAGKSWTSVDVQTDSIYEKGFWQDISFMNEQTGFMAGGRSISRSTDGGKNWHFEPENKNDMVLGVKCHGNRVFLYGYSTFSWSDDLGETWNSRETEPLKIISLSFAGEHAFASAISGFYTSTDEGDSWTLLSDSAKIFERIDFLDEQNGVASYTFIPSAHASALTRIAISSDGGRIWNTVDWQILEDAGAAFNAGAPVLYLAKDEIYVGAVNGIYLSRDGGLSWEKDWDPDVYGGYVWVEDLARTRNSILAVGWGGVIVKKPRPDCSCATD